MGKKIELSDIELKLQFENLQITIVQVGYGVFYNSITKHSHGKSYYEAHLVVGGKGTLIANNNSYPLYKGILYMTGPNIVHEQISSKDELMEEYCIGLEIKKVRNTLDTEISKALFDTHFWICENDNENSSVCEQLFESISAESLLRSIGYQNNIKNYVSCILVALVRAYTGNPTCTEHVSHTLDDKRTITIDNAFLYDYDTVTRKGLAKRLGLSERQLQRILFIQYGKSFSELKREARLNKIDVLLKQDKSREEIAEIMGYRDLRSIDKLINHLLV